MSSARAGRFWSSRLHCGPADTRLSVEPEGHVVYDDALAAAFTIMIKGLHEDEYQPKHPDL